MIIKTVGSMTRTAAIPMLEPYLIVDATIATMGSLHKVGVLSLQQCEVLLGFPVPPGRACEEKIHLLEGPLIRFWIECPDDGKSQNVNSAENVEDFLPQSLKHDG